MLSVYLCEDMKEQADCYYKIIKNFVLFKEWDIQVHPPCYPPSVLLEQLKPGCAPGLYFLDIDLNDSIDGFSLARQIRSLDLKGFIVFLTAHEEQAGLAFRYHIEALDYIVKGDPSSVKEAIEACISEAYLRYRNTSEADEDLVSFKSGSKVIFLKRKEIVSLSTSDIPHQLMVATNQQLFSVYGNLKDYEQILGPDFLRIQKSCLINRNEIQEVDYGESCIQLKNGMIFHVSTRKIKTLKFLTGGFFLF